MSINDFVEMTIFLCLISFSIHAKMQGFVNECVPFFILRRNSRWPLEMVGKRFLRKFSTGLKNFIEITLSCTVSEINAFLRFTQKFEDGHQKMAENHF